MKIDWDRYVDEDEEEEGFDKSAVSFFVSIRLYMLNIPLTNLHFQTTSLKYSLMEVWISEELGECLEVRQQTSTKVLLVYQLSGYPFSK